MKLIVGLGNPGKRYVDSRHNIGFSVVKALSRVYKISLKKDSGTFSLSGKGKIKDQNVVLAMPLTFMNLSGIAIGALLKKYKIDLPRSFYSEEKPQSKKERGLDNLLVVCDDLDLAWGRLKIRPSGSSGGHHGLQSIIDSIGSRSFCRLCIGIGKPYANIDVAEYVLSSFTKEEKGKREEIIEKACYCCEVWVSEGVSKSMNIFNRKIYEDSVLK